MSGRSMQHLTELNRRLNKLLTQNLIEECSLQADEEIRTLDPLLGKEMLYH